MTLENIPEFRHWPLKVGADSFFYETAPDVVEPDAVFAKVAAEEGDPTPGHVSASTIWRRQDAHPIALLAACLDRYGKESLEYEPDVLQLMFQRDNISVAKTAWQKLLAVRVLVMSPSPWRRANTFNWVVLGLSGVEPNFAVLELPEVWKIAHALDLMKILDPKREFSPEVMKFIAAFMSEEGLRWAFEPIYSVCGRELEQRQIRCKKCDARRRDDDDVRCITCRSTELEKIPYPFESLRDLTRDWFEKYKGATIAQVESLPLGTPQAEAGARLYLEYQQVLALRKSLPTQLRMVMK